MAFGLRFNGQGAINAGTVAAAAASCNELKIEFDMLMPNSSQNDTKIFSLTGGDLIIIGPQSNRTMRVWCGGTVPGRVMAYSDPLPSGVRFRFASVINRATATSKIFVDDILQRTVTTPANSANFPPGTMLIGAENTSGGGRSTFDLYRLKIWGDGVLIYDFNPDLSGGTGPTLIDAVAGRNGNQFLTWPTDNAEWFEYIAAGGVAAEFLTSLKSLSNVQSSLKTDVQIATEVSALSVVNANLNTALLFQTTLTSSSFTSSALTTGSPALASNFKSSSQVTQALTTSIRFNSDLKGSSLTSGILAVASTSIYSNLKSSSSNVIASLASEVRLLSLQNSFSYVSALLKTGAGFQTQQLSRTSLAANLQASVQLASNLKSDSFSQNALVTGVLFASNLKGQTVSSSGLLTGVQLQCSFKTKSTVDSNLSFLFTGFTYEAGTFGTAYHISESTVANFISESTVHISDNPDRVNYWRL